MNFSCPNYQIDGHCERLDEPCRPVQEGCIMEGKVKVAAEEKQTEKNEADGPVD